METSEDQLTTDKKTLTADELKRLTSFFEILIQIDQRERKKECKK